MVNEIIVRPDGRFGDVKVICPCGYMDKFSRASFRHPRAVAEEHNNTKHGGKYHIHYTLDES
jgi:hypothetical protein